MATLLTPRSRRTAETTGASAGASTGSASGSSTGWPTGSSVDAGLGTAASTSLVVPPEFRTTLGCDAVGVPARYGFRVLSRLPAKGCVYADTDWWWWLVPTGSDLDVNWPLPSCYAPGAEVPDRRPRLIHHPDGTSPYTPPIPLYLLTCQLTGIAPSWTALHPAGDGVVSGHVHPSGPDRP